MVGGGGYQFQIGGGGNEQFQDQGVDEKVSVGKAGWEALLEGVAKQIEHTHFPDVEELFMLARVHFVI